MTNSTMEQAFSLASQSQKAGNHQDAVKLYKAIIEVRPDHAWANHNLGSLKRESGTPHEAIGYLKAALLADDGEALFWISYIDSLIELGLIADAEATLTQARSLGLNEDVAAQLEHKAHAAAQTIVSLDSDPSQLERKEVATSYNTAKYAIAEQQAVALTRKYPNHALGWKVLGAVFLSTNRKTESVEMMQQAIRCSAQDADAHKTLGLILSEVGRSREAEASYREAIRLNPALLEAYIGLGVLLKKVGRKDEAEAAYRDALRIRPESAQAHNNLGNLLSDRGRYSEAEESYRSAISQKPDYAEAYSNLGILLKDRGRASEAEAAFREALQLKADCAEAHLNLANVLRDLNRLTEAEKSLRQAILIKPDFAEAYSLCGIVLNGLGQLRDAELSLREAIKLKPGFHDALWNLSLNLLLQSRVEEGLILYEHRWHGVEALRKSQRHFPQPLWLGRESLTGKTILIHAEQGLGDTLQFCRYLQMVKSLGATVIFETYRPLMELLTGLKGVDELVSKGQPSPKFDYHCPLLSLPLAFNTKLETIPAPIRYLTAQPERVARWKDRLGPNGLKVGVCWRSSDLINERSIPLECLAGLSKIRGVRLISLHKGDGEKELATLPADLHVESLGSEFDSDGAFVDTAAVIECCDLVITTDTSVAHLAGALGARTWVMLPFVPDWRWMMEREDSPWYPTAKLFRQKTAGNWQTIVDGMHLALKTDTESHHKSTLRPHNTARERRSAWSR